MPQTPWAINHPHHDVVGPRYCKPGTVLSGFEVRADQSAGLMDLRLCFASPGGSEVEHPHSDWVTHYVTHDWETSVRFDPTKEYVAGMIVRERHGCGVVDFRLILNQRDGDQRRETEWVLNCEDVTETHQIKFDDDSEMCGILAKERPSEGIVDLLLIA